MNFFNFLKKNENTIANEVIINGIGLHSGNSVKLILKPSEDGGIIFKNNNGTTIKALYNNVIDTKLGTTIGLNINDNTEKFLTIEHLMAAIWACNIDNLIIEIYNQETPILDGSAMIFIQEIKKVGIKKLNSKRKYLKILNEITVEEGDKYIKILPSRHLSVDITVNFSYGKIGKQNYLFNGNKENFVKNIAEARTFCNMKEIEYMHSIGLAMGGSENCAMIFNEEGLINKDGFRIENEVAKHKLLDCLGDMYTSGYNIIGKIISYKGGHTLNNLLLKKIFSDEKNYKIK